MVPSISLAPETPDKQQLCTCDSLHNLDNFQPLPFWFLSYKITLTRHELGRQLLHQNPKVHGRSRIRSFINEMRSAICNLRRQVKMSGARRQ